MSGQKIIDGLKEAVEYAKAHTYRKCCYLQDGKAGGASCAERAEWEIFGSNEPREPIDACTEHVGDLLDDSPETRIYPIKV